MPESFEIPDGAARLRIDLEDDVRSFLIDRLIWNRMPLEQREKLRDIGVNIKRLRRPSYIAVTSGNDHGPPGTKSTRCNIGAEGVMTHVDERVIHLAFKCGNPEHRFHYSQFDVDTVAAMAKATEEAWPGSVSERLINTEDEVINTPVLDPGPDEAEEELEFLDELEDDDEDDDIVI